MQQITISIYHAVEYFFIWCAMDVEALNKSSQIVNNKPRYIGFIWFTKPEYICVRELDKHCFK